MFSTTGYGDNWYDATAILHRLANDPWFARFTTCTTTCRTSTSRARALQLRCPHFRSCHYNNKSIVSKTTLCPTPSMYSTTSYGDN